MAAHPFDPAALRREFPAAEKMLYLDIAFQAPLARPVHEALLKFYDQALYSAGPKNIWLERVEDVRRRFASFISADPSEIAFTKNTSEALNIAANAIPFRSGDNVLMIEGDHPNNTYAFLNLQHKGVEVRFVQLEAESATARTFEPFIDSRTRAISISHVTFHAGHRFDIQDIGRLCRDRNLHFVVDAMQSVGVLPLNVQQVGASFLALGTHKGLLVPQGLGLLYVRNGQADLKQTYLATAGIAKPPSDLIARHGDLALREGARRFELGNYNLPAIHALDAALGMIEEVGVPSISEHVLALGDRLIERLDERGIPLIGPRTRGHRAHICTLGLRGDAWLRHFERNDVRVSPERDGVRVAFGMFNTEADLDRFCDVLDAGPASA